jgi:hypothetical protein
MEVAARDPSALVDGRLTLGATADAWEGTTRVDRGVTVDVP